MQKKISILLLISVLFITGCASTHQGRVNEISYAMRDFNAAWDVVDSGILKLYQTHTVGKNVREKRDLIADIQIRLNENWKSVPQTDASIEAFIQQKDFQSGLSLLLELGDILNTNGIEFNFPSLPTFKREVNQ